MPVVFNPFTGNLDLIDNTAAAGSDTQVQFNDGGVLGGDSGLVFNKTTNALTGGAFIPSSSTVPTNGVYLPSANNVAISTNGTGRLFVNSSGNVGVGTASPAVTTHISSSSAETLRLQHAASPYQTFYLGSNRGAFILSNSSYLQIAAESSSNNTIMFDTGGSERARIDSSGRLLVGTSSARTDLIAGTRGGQVQIEAANSNAATALDNSGLCLTMGSAASFGSANIFFTRTKSNSLGGVDLVADNDILGGLYFQGTDGTNAVPAALIKAEVDGTPAYAATDLVNGQTYRIVTVGTTDFTLIGASANTVGTVFTATGSGTGTGTAILNEGNMPGRLIFSTTADGASSPTERMRINSAGQIEAGSLGTAAAPVWSFLNDTNTGIYSPGADQVAISTNGTGRLFVDSSGNVGVGTTSPGATFETRVDSAGGAPLGALLTNSSVFANTSIGIAFQPNTSQGTARYAIIYGINESGGSGNATGLAFHTNGNGGPPLERARIDSSGTFRVKGAGTAGVNDAVQLNGSAPANSLLLDASGRLLLGTSSSVGSNAKIQAITGDLYCYEAYQTGANAYPAQFNFTKTRGTAGTFTVVATEDYLGTLSFRGTDGSAIKTAAEIHAVVDGTPGANDMPGRLVFSVTADGASSPTEAMRIKNSRILNFANTPVYADNAAAKTGGLVDGDVYRKSDGTLMIVYT